MFFPISNPSILLGWPPITETPGCHQWYSLREDRDTYEWEADYQVGVKWYSSHWCPFWLHSHVLTRRVMTGPCGVIDLNALGSSLTRLGLDIRITRHNCLTCTFYAKEFITIVLSSHIILTAFGTCWFGSMLHQDSYGGRGREIRRHVQADVPHEPINWRCSRWEYLRRGLPLYNHLWVKIFPSPFSSREIFWRPISEFVGR